MGTRFKARVLPVDPWRATDYAIDIRSDARGPYFELRVPEPLPVGFDATVLSVVPEDRHLREWCRVLLNTETEAPSMPRMAFLD